MSRRRFNDGTPLSELLQARQSGTGHDIRQADVLFLGCVVLIAMLARLLCLYTVSTDMMMFLLPWVKSLRELGGWKAMLASDIGANYQPFYMYLLMIPAGLGFSDGAVFAYIKMISYLSDMMAAFAVGRLAYQATGTFRRAAIGTAGALLLPTVFLNSAAFCQCDSLWAGLCLMAVGDLRKGRRTRCVFFMSMALAAKLQAIFLLPFLVIAAVCGLLGLRHVLGLFILWPAWSLPCLLAGRSASSLLSVLLGGNINRYDSIGMNSANIWSFMGHVSGGFLEPFVWCGVLMAVIALGILAYGCIYAGKAFLESPEVLLLTAALSVAICVFFLPKMHDRYDYLTDLLVLAMAVVSPRFLKSAVLRAGASFGAYMQFFTDGTQDKDAMFLLMFGLMSLAAVYFLAVEWIALVRENTCGGKESDAV